MLITAIGSFNRDTETIWVATIFFPRSSVSLYSFISFSAIPHINPQIIPHISPFFWLSVFFPFSLPFHYFFVPAGHFSLSLLFFPSMISRTFLFCPVYQTQNTTWTLKPTWMGEIIPSCTGAAPLYPPPYYYPSIPLSFPQHQQPTHQPKSRPTACVSACG